MSDHVIIDGDTATFMPNFAPATIIPVPGRITGSGPPTATGKPLCIDGDEGSVEVPGVVYMTPQYSIPGTGTLKIDALGSDQLSQVATVDGTALILKGSTFTAKLEVQSPAQQPAPPGPPVPDSTPSYTGNGQFVTTNTLYTAG
jgi:hypothetical protein